MYIVKTDGTSDITPCQSPFPVCASRHVVNDITRSCTGRDIANPLSKTQQAFVAVIEVLIPLKMVVRD